MTSPNIRPVSPAAIPSAAYVNAIPSAYIPEARIVRVCEPPLRLPRYPTVTGRMG